MWRAAPCTRSGPPCRSCPQACERVPRGCSGSWAKGLLSRQARVPLSAIWALSRITFASLTNPYSSKAAAGCGRRGEKLCPPKIMGWWTYPTLVRWPLISATSIDQCAHPRIRRTRLDSSSDQLADRRLAYSVDQPFFQPVIILVQNPLGMGDRVALR